VSARNHYGWRPGFFAALLFLSVMIVVAIMQMRADRDRYHLQTERMDTWTSFGGVWDLNDGVFNNNSDERGAKLVSGSPKWSDVSLSADVRLGHDEGDAGLMMRAQNEEMGVDAYNGYYAGLRPLEGTLIAGRSNYSWSEVAPVAMPGGVHEGVWYHVALVMFGCRLGVSAENLTTHQTAFLVLHEEQCLPAGRIGLRSLSAGVQWRNVVAQKSTAGQLDSIAAHTGGDERPQPLTTEAAYAKHFTSYKTIEPVASNGHDERLRKAGVHIGDIVGLRGDAPQRVIVRGVVTLTTPDLYIEDSTGGAVVKNPQGPPVTVGEGVEVAGEPHPLLYSALLDHSSVHITSTGSPAPPLSVTSWQAASGTYDARFIETEGRLLREVYSDSGYEVLDLAQGGETFRALYPDRSGHALRGLRVNSLLKLRGVCVLGKTYTQELIPFLIFLRSSDDVQVLQGPPWWTPWHVTFLVLLVVLAACSMQLLYFRFRHWKLDAISRERERLAHDIHDTMAQSFAGIGYQIQGLRSSIIRNTAVSREEIADELASTSELVSRCHADASRTIEMLGAPSPEESGDLLGMLAEKAYKLSGGKLSVSKEEQGKIRVIRDSVRAVLLHIGQEAISNAITHGQPSAMTFTMLYEARSATLMIVDDGCGFDAGPEEQGFGVMGMKSRAKGIGGTLEVLSAPGVGTRVGVTFPISRFMFFRSLLSENLLRYVRRSPANPAHE
jgi:signal transduction histidine kinase